MFRDEEDFLSKATRASCGYTLTKRQVEQLCLYGEMLLEWNEKINLTTITEPREIVIKHFVDSMALGPFIKGTRIADVGTGAGFPGLPLKILKPECMMVLVDSSAKRLEFLKAVISELRLEKIETVHARAEEFGRMEKYRESFDCVTARAVARLPLLLEYTLPLVKENGLFLASKGLQAEEEVVEAERALTILGGKVDKVEKFSLGAEAEHRAIVVIRKIKKTPKEYPRRAGLPAQKPLV